MLDPTAGLIGLTVFDVVIVALTWREYHEQRQRHHDDSIRTAAGTNGRGAAPAGATRDAAR